MACHPYEECMIVHTVAAWFLSTLSHICDLLNLGLVVVVFVGSLSAGISFSLPWQAVVSARGLLARNRVGAS
ncbi:hypothetical protein PHAMO_10105 [Magnetospirillum molischianum DSM 120]|uniref:Uncharacterized protein n=1 Tax=Magnetospirillum molischianum DSM 120 TaxID=1150626 RepID=H8FMU2_MAGML|nr:hypothetical protein PHAMO_10105 [Magnetospirillum molischianum DSM 120]